MAATISLPDGTPFTVAEQKARAKGKRDEDGNVAPPEIWVWACGKCGHKSFTPMYVCPVDRSRDVRPAQAPLEGRIESFTVQKISIEEFINEIPFAFAVVKLDDGTLVSGWVPDVATDRDLRIGDRVRFSPSYKPGYMFEKA